MHAHAVFCPSAIFAKWPRRCFLHFAEQHRIFHHNSWLRKRRTKELTCTAKNLQAVIIALFQNNNLASHVALALFKKKRSASFLRLLSLCQFFIFLSLSVEKSCLALPKGRGFCCDYWSIIRIVDATPSIKSSLGILCYEREKVTQQ